MVTKVGDLGVSPGAGREQHCSRYKNAKTSNGGEHAADPAGLS
jgi:hypothetical protein